MENPQSHVPQEQGMSQSAELHRPQASLNQESHIGFKKSDQKKIARTPRYGLPEEYPRDDLFLP